MSSGYKSGYRRARSNSYASKKNYGYRKSTTKNGKDKSNGKKNGATSSAAKNGKKTIPLSVNSLRQALWVLQNMEVVRPGVYRVRSSGKNSGDRVYEFTTEKCSCDGFRIRGHCKHITAALMFEAVTAVLARTSGSSPSRGSPEEGGAGDAGEVEKGAE